MQRLEQVLRGTVVRLTWVASVSCPAGVMQERQWRRVWETRRATVPWGTACTLTVGILVGVRALHLLLRPTTSALCLGASVVRAIRGEERIRRAGASRHDVRVSLTVASLVGSREGDVRIPGAGVMRKRTALKHGLPDDAGTVVSGT